MERGSPRVEPGGPVGVLGLVRCLDRQSVGVEEVDPVGIVVDGARATVGADADRPESPAGITAQHPRELGTAPQRGQQVRAGVGRVVQVHALHRQQQRAVDVPGRKGLGTDASGVRGDCLHACPACLGEGDHPRDGCQQRQHADTGQQPAQPAVGPGLALRAFLGGALLSRSSGAARLEELALRLRRSQLTVGDTRLELLEPAALRQVARIAT